MLSANLFRGWNSDAIVFVNEAIDLGNLDWNNVRQVAVLLSFGGESVRPQSKFILTIK